MNRPDLYPSRCGAAPGITERLDPVVYARDWLRGPLNQSQVRASEATITERSSQAGSLIMFDCNTLHGSNGNITPFPRSNAFFVYNAVSNRVGNPFSGQAPRPGYICTRE
jgi:ectoine hydroxylase-related dioxygenase (phytanoyl-CoA dioxygenase family)